MGRNVLWHIAKGEVALLWRSGQKADMTGRGGTSQKYRGGFRWGSQCSSSENTTAG
jgi:hypothetical protein